MYTYILKCIFVTISSKPEAESKAETERKHSPVPADCWKGCPCPVAALWLTRGYLFFRIGHMASCLIHCGKYSCVATCFCFPGQPFPPPQIFPEMKKALKVLLTPVLARAHLNRDSVVRCGFHVRSWEISHSDISQLSSDLPRLQQSNPKMFCQVS